MADAVLNSLKRKLAVFEQVGREDKVKATAARIRDREATATEVRTLNDMTKVELLEMATEADVVGRSQMSKAELVEALTED